MLVTTWIGVLAVLLGATAGAVTDDKKNGPFGPNFHEVEKGKLYRSGQLSAKELGKKIDQFHFRTILNLRGESQDGWYTQEAAVAKEKGVTLINISMSASRLPHRAELRKMLETFDSAAQPILVHCQAGADRTGQAMVIYALDYMHQPLAKALDMLSSKYFHFDFMYPAPRYFLTHIYKGRKWALDDYDPCVSKDGYKYYDQSKYCRGLDDDDERGE